MAATKSKAKKPAAKANRVAAPKAATTAKPVKKTAARATKKTSSSNEYKQLVNILAFVFTCLCLIFMAVAYYAYS